MRAKRAIVVGAVVLTATLGLSGCIGPQSEVVAGSSLSVAISQPFTSSNPSTSLGNTEANGDIAYATSSGFNYYDDTPKLVTDTSFGSYEKVSDDPLVVKYTIADGVTWSDGTAVDAADLLLNWVAHSGAENTPGFDVTKYIEPDTGALSQDFPSDVVYFDSGADPSTGLGLVTAVPTMSDDRKSITLTYDSPFVDWELALRTAGVPAHVVAEKALGSKDAATAKDAIVTAITDRDPVALAKIAHVWNTGFNLTQMPSDPSLLLSDGPYVVTDFVADQYVVLTANKSYTGAHQPKIATITVKFIPDPLAEVLALQNREVQVISPQVTVDVADALAALDVTVLGGYEGTYEHLDLQFDQSKSGNFGNPLIREAFLKVVPRQEIVDKLVSSLQPDATVRNSQVFLPGAEGYDDSVATNGSAAFTDVDIDGAKALLAQAGVSNPEVCILFAPTNPRRVNEFQLIQQSAALAGFAVTDCSSANWLAVLGTPGAYDAALYGWDPTNLGASASAIPVFSSTGIDNHNFYRSTEMDLLTAKLSKQLDPAMKLQLEKSIDELAWSDFYGVTLFQFPAIAAYDQKAVASISPSTLPPTLFWNVWDWTPVTTTK